MSEPVTLSDEQMEQLAKAVRGHTCRFDDKEAHSLHRFAETLDDNGFNNWLAVLGAGATIRKCQAAGIIALMTTIVGACLYALYAGIKSKLTGG